MQVLKLSFSDNPFGILVYMQVISERCFTHCEVQYVYIIEQHYQLCFIG